MHERGEEGGDDESAAVTMASVEEILEGYEWASDDIVSRKGRGVAGGAADLIEARLLDELLALEKVCLVAKILAPFNQYLKLDRPMYTHSSWQTTG
jgi:hypothetical protein